MRHYLTASVVILLAACSGGENKQAEGGGSSVGSGKTAAAEAPPAVGTATMQPGEWEMVTEVTDMSIPGMPAGAMPKSAMQKTSIKTCLKPDQTGKPDAGFFSGRKNSNCTYDGFEMTAGTVHGTISCPGRDGTQKIAITGKYEPENYDIVMDMASKQMSMKMHTTGTRVGECPAG